MIPAMAPTIISGVRPLGARKPRTGTTKATNPIKCPNKRELPMTIYELAT
jgi:hypothetical protein